MAQSTTTQERQLTTIGQVVVRAETDFEELAKVHNAVNFKQEASFALQILKQNEYLCSVAAGNQDALKYAILNVAAIGLSLNPVLKLAYLIPRDKRVQLDISYVGFIKLAVDIGAIKFAVAEIVYEKDEFKYLGLGREPHHPYLPFGDRGRKVGAYCVAKTPDGDFITTIMSLEPIYKARARSEAYKAGKGPWITDEDEMIKKTVIRRAYKSWPKANSSSIFGKAIEIAAAVDPQDFEDAETQPADGDHAISRIRELLALLDRSEENFVEYLGRIFKREISKLSDLAENEANQAIVFLEGFAARKDKKGAANENAG